jgi:hypothetical protein
VRPEPLQVFAFPYHPSPAFPEDLAILIRYAQLFSGGVPQTPVAARANSTDASFRSFRASHPTTARPPLSPLRYTCFYSGCQPERFFLNPVSQSKLVHPHRPDGGQSGTDVDMACSLSQPLRFCKKKQQHLHSFWSQKNQSRADY